MNSAGVVPDPFPSPAPSTPLRVAVIDVGSPKSAGLGWWISDPGAQGGGDLDRCIEAVAEAMKSGPVALGFEAPTFVPLRAAPAELLMARKGEGNRAFSAGAGAGVATVGLVISCYTLARLRALVPDAAASLDWRRSGGWHARELLLFEAFVTGRKRPKTDPDRHVQDAKDAAMEFLRHGSPSAVPSAIEDGTPWLNMLGAAMLRTGLTADVSVLGAPCLVVKA